jgi:hypothetical protein
MGETPAAAALSLEAFHDISVLGPDSRAWNFCRAVADYSETRTVTKEGRHFLYLLSLVRL